MAKPGQRSRSFLPSVMTRSASTPARSSTSSASRPVPPPRPCSRATPMTLSDSRNKARALGRIKRLASSGLPLEPFVRSIFELINDAVPNSPNRSLHVGGERSDAYICSTPEVVGIALLHNHYFVESSQASGTRFPLDLH